MSDKFKVTESVGLLKFLIANLGGWTRSRVKQRLLGNCVTVNGEAISKHDHILMVADNVEVLASSKMIKIKSNSLEIIYSDKDLIVINKPAGLLSVADGKTDNKNAMSLLRTQLSRPNKQIKLWPVHRLDRDTSGVLLFATSHEMREAVNALWSDAEKVYLAIVEGSPDPKRGTIDKPLRMDAVKYHMHVGVHPDAKQAITHYDTMRTLGKNSLLEVKLETGRQHQIRAHLSWLGNSVIGDTRYGTLGHRMGLHALRLSIIHPVTKSKLTFETPPPLDFNSLLK